MKLLITGGSGFIGTNLIRKIITTEPRWSVANIDVLTYAGNENSVPEIKNHPRYRHYQSDIRDFSDLGLIFEKEKPTAVIHLAAESHVDRSIGSPAEFIQTNIFGTYGMLEAARHYLGGIGKGAARGFKFIHVSTDEVYGSLGDLDEPFHETSRYKPNSPYSASKASSDFLARTWRKTYNLPTIITHCSNNYGPFQNTEKFIPKAITNFLEKANVPIYGTGENIRDWIHVDDHCSALIAVLEKGAIGQTYCIGGENEIANNEIVERIRLGVEKITGTSDLSHLTRHIADRPGHDYRYAIKVDKLKKLGWKAEINFEQGIADTIDWYIKNRQWWRRRHGDSVFYEKYSQ